MSSFTSSRGAGHRLSNRARSQRSSATVTDFWSSRLIFLPPSPFAARPRTRGAPAAVDARRGDVPRARGSRKAETRRRRRRVRGRRGLPGRRPAHAAPAGGGGQHVDRRRPAGQGRPGARPRAGGQRLLAEQRGEALLDRARAAEAQDDLKTARPKVKRPRRRRRRPFLLVFLGCARDPRRGMPTAKSAIDRALTLAPDRPDDPVRGWACRHPPAMTPGARDYWHRALAADPNGPTGKAAREALGISVPPRQRVRRQRPG